MSRESWKRIAIALGDAMQNHSFCFEHDEEHPEPDCPFCGDRTVYARYRAFAEKNGGRFPDPLEGAESVSLFDLRAGALHGRTLTC